MSIKENIKGLEEWLASHPHLPHVTEFQMACFLHSCHYNLELAKTTIANFFSLRTSSPKMFAYPGEEQVKNTGAVGISLVLPEKSPKGCSIMFMKLLNPNPNVYDFENILNFFEKIIYLTLEQNGPYGEGVTLLFDWNGFTLGHLPKFHINVIRKLLFFLQNAVPVRLSNVHIFNINSALKTIINLSKPFFNQEFMNLLFLHQHVDEVFQYIPQELFPEDFGGKAPSVAALTEKAINSIIQNSKVFELLDRQKVDNEKKPKIYWTHRLFGSESWFRKS